MQSSPRMLIAPVLKAFSPVFLCPKGAESLPAKGGELEDEWEGNWDGKCVVHVFISLMVGGSVGL